MDEPRIEHHYHDPSPGQIHKAVRQYLTDEMPKKDIEALVEAKIREVVSQKVENWINTGKFNQAITEAVAHYVSGEKRTFERYGIQNRLRNLVEQQLKDLLVSEYEIKVEKR